MSDQQMRSVITRYPVDRYMVECSKKYEMVNIIDDDLWNTEPALKPEDEIILRKLHEMLQSTADDLKLLSGELSKYHEPGVQVKTAPTPLDEEFNEKVHIEEIVNAKFHGYKIVDKPLRQRPTLYRPKIDVANILSPKDNTLKSNKNKANPCVNSTQMLDKPVSRNLGISHTKVIQIDGNQDHTNSEKLNNDKVVNAPVAYNEYSFKYEEPKLNTPCKGFQVQVMPSVNIRSELKEQKVLQLDILPEMNKSEKSDIISRNVAVVAVKHEEPRKQVVKNTVSTKFNKLIDMKQTSKPIRKVSKLSPCDSSASIISSDTQIKMKTQKRLLTNIVRSNLQKELTKKGSEKRSQSNLNEWRKKLNVVYGPSNKTKPKVSPKKKNGSSNSCNQSYALNNSEYIPYSKLTIGGARVSDIEREISKIPNKNNLPLSPILDKIMGSRENSFENTSPRKHKNDNRLKVLTTSDENLLQEVINIEKSVSDTLSKNIKSADNDRKPALSDSDETKENESYADDFEDDKSDNSGQSEQKSRHSCENSKRNDNEVPLHPDICDTHKDVKDVKTGPSTSNINDHNLTYTKVPKLSLKNQIDVYEFIHSVNTQESSTQSFGAQRISPKETQTTPRTETNVQPIHNDLWPTIDPKGQVEKMFELEKELIKKLIVEEYGGILQQNINKPSTSEESKNKLNVIASQKNTQTSPAHVKHVMTSPTRTKTRTTSPFTTITVDHHTSPLVFVTNENDVKLETTVNEKDLDISINLSSPRFSLRLPQNSQEVLSNFEDSIDRSNKKTCKPTDIRKSSTEVRKSASAVKNIKQTNLNITTTSTSSVEVDSSDFSSLGEVKLRRLLAKNIMRKNSSDCESVFSSSSSNYSSGPRSGILPLRSEGEMSLGLIKKCYKHSKSEGEASFGML